jgi:hypothetical protein
MKAGGIVRAVLALAVLAAAPGATSSSAVAGNVRVRIVGANNGQDVSNGGVSGRGHFTSTGAITDKGTVVAYRTVKGSLPGGLITLRFVTTGARGMITYVVKIDTGRGTARWTITAATRGYAGLHGTGKESENADHTVALLTGSVSR